MFSYTAKLLLLIAVISISLSACFTYLHLDYTADQAMHDLENQNFELIRKKDALGLARRLDALTADGRWECIVGIKNETVFFRSDDNSCGTSFFRRSITIGNPIERFSVSLILVPPFYFRAFLVSLNAGLLALLIGTVFLIKRHNEENHLLIHQLFESTRQTAHDIRSPISAINLITQSLDLRGEAQNLLTTSVNRLEKMASDLMKQSKEYKDLIAGSQVLPNLSCKTKDVLEAIAAISKEYRALLAEKDISVELSIDSSNLAPSSSLVCSSFELQRILVNLINNSAESMLTGGTILINVERSFDQALTIAVRDSGPGFKKSLFKLLGKKVVTYGKN